MPEIRLEHITKRWGKFYGVDDLNLVIETTRIYLRKTATEQREIVDTIINW